ncbi:MAG: acyl-CoA dehydrogenase family protein [Nitrospirae bacterium]|nr:acyl-CoA dehydrogenase family protein [Nitrospirota bacterium]
MTHPGPSDLQSFRDLARRFATQELEPRALEMDEYPFRPLDRGVLKAAREAGLLDVMLPEDRGGAGPSVEAFCEILLTLAKSDAGFASVVLVSTLAQQGLIAWGAPGLVESRERSSLIAFPAYDLPSDLQRDLKARKQGDGFSLDGKVEYLALAPVADAMIVPATLNDPDRVGLFLVDSAERGISIGDPVLSLGLRSCPVADVGLESVKVPAERLLCRDAGRAFAELAERFRPAVAALAVGVLTASFEAAMSYAKQRYQGGCMIIEHDQVRMMLANMAVVAESGNALVRAMARAVDGGESWALPQAGLILLTEQVSRATTDGVQCLGGYGYMRDYGQEKRMRDAKQIESLFGAVPLKRLDLLTEILGKS